MKEILHYNTLQTLSLRVWPDARVARTNYFERWEMYVKGKMIFFDLTDGVNNRDAKFRIENTCLSHVRPDNTEKLFVSPKSKIPRDILRNSGYHIVLDQAKADAIVIPKLKKEEPFAIEHYNALVIEGERIHLVDIDKRNWPDDLGLEKEHIEAIDKYIKEELFKDQQIEIKRKVDYSQFNICYVTNCNEFEDILLEKYVFIRKYVPDDRVHVIPAVNIDKETLITWELCRDEDLFEKAVINSNYQEYPFTTAIFLYGFKRQMTRYSNNQQFKRVLDIIEYNKIEDYYPVSYQVTPQDWAMLQSWIMYKLDLPDNGGWVDEEAIKRLPYPCEELVKTRVACTSVKLNDAMNIDILKNQIKNSSQVF